MTGAFERIFHRAPLLSATAPGRVNLLGEHTDYSEGFVLPTALSLVTTVEIGPSPDGRFRLYSDDHEGSAATVEYGGAVTPSGYGRYIHGCVEILRKEGATIPGFTMAVSSTVPIGAGLSSSAALEIAVLRALRAMHGLPFDDRQLAQFAQRAEIAYAGVRCGIMDQMASSVGVPGKLLFLDTRTLATRILPFPPQTEIVVLDCGVPRSLAVTGYNERRAECEAAASALGVGALRDITELSSTESLPEPLRKRARHVVSENQRVLRAIEGPDAEGFGVLMNESHRSLRDDFEVSIPALDALVDCLRAQPGVFGTKLTGAGFGGACVALLEAGRGDEVKAAALDEFVRRGHRGTALV